MMPAVQLMQVMTPAFQLLLTGASNDTNIQLLCSHASSDLKQQYITAANYLVNPQLIEPRGAINYGIN